MVDFHTHILPEMDDGSKNVLESCRMLACSADYGVQAMVATPHFRRADESVARFLKRRQAQYEKLMAECIAQPAPRIVLGAEVSFFPGISEEADLEKLCIDGTKLLLMELPSTLWSSQTLTEVYSLMTSRGITPVVAHIDRYLCMPYIEQLIAMNTPVQINSSAFATRRISGRLFRLLGQHRLFLLGSDCHGMEIRPPNLDIACKFIGSKQGETKLHAIECFARRLLGLETEKPVPHRNRPAGSGEFQIPG